MTKRPRDNRRNGLTLIELVAALVLLSVLMAALTGLIPRFAARSSDREAARQLERHAWSRKAVERVAADLGNAAEGQIGGRQLILEGLLERDPSSGRLTDRPGTCRYRMVPLREQTLLVREQNGKRTLLGTGRISLAVQAVLHEGQITSGQLLGGPTDEAAAPEPLELAARMRVALRDEAGEQLAAVPVFRQAFAEGEPLAPEDR